jgi:hypothetical protein
MNPGKALTTHLLIGSFPEILLAPAGKDIRVYTRGSDLGRPILVPKNQFAAKVWKKDALVARQVCHTQVGCGDC